MLIEVMKKPAHVSNSSFKMVNISVFRLNPGSHIGLAGLFTVAIGYGQ